MNFTCVMKIRCSGCGKYMEIPMEKNWGTYDIPEAYEIDIIDNGWTIVGCNCYCATCSINAYNVNVFR